MKITGSDSDLTMIAALGFAKRKNWANASFQIRSRLWRIFRAVATPDYWLAWRRCSLKAWAQICLGNCSWSIFC